MGQGTSILVCLGCLAAAADRRHAHAHHTDGMTATPSYTRNTHSHTHTAADPDREVFTSVAFITRTWRGSTAQPCRVLIHVAY